MCDTQYKVVSKTIIPQNPSNLTRFYSKSSFLVYIIVDMDGFVLCGVFAGLISREGISVPLGTG